MSVYETANFGLRAPGDLDVSNDVPMWMQQLADDVDGALTTFKAAAWTSYAPTWTGETSGTGDIGTGGVLIGYKHKVNSVMHWHMRLLIGSGATGPGGVYRFALPATAVMRYAADQKIGTVQFSGGTYQEGSVFARHSSGGTAMVLRFHGQTSPSLSGVTNNPGAWVEGTSFQAGGSYEVAP